MFGALYADEASGVSDESEDYRRGLIEGRLSALEDRHSEHKTRLDNHESRITAQERVMWGVLGAFILMEILPTVSEFLSA